MNWNWDHLRYFNTLAEQGTLSEAARQLDVSHSTVQRHITALENELDVQLFSQLPSGFILTAAGNELYNETAGIRDVLQSISSRIAGSDQELNGRVTITVTDTFGHFLLPAITDKIQIRYPDIRLDLEIRNKLDDLQNLEADIAIRTCTEPPPELIGRKVGELRFALCTSANYLEANELTRDNAEKLARHYIQLNSNFSGSVFDNWQPASDAEPAITRINGFMGAYRLCKAGLGLALLPAYITELDEDLIKLECDHLPDSNSLWILSHESLRTKHSVSAVRKLLHSSLTTLFAP